MITETSQRPQYKFERVIALMAISLMLMFVLGCPRGLTSKAKGQASNIGCEASVGFVKGELDAGIKVNVTVKNVGETGFITIKPELSTSEGEWNRSQDLQFQAGETKALSYFFDEPTVNARSIQCRVGIFPNAD